jgi:hypothetical protein
MIPPGNSEMPLVRRDFGRLILVRVTRERKAFVAGQTYSTVTDFARLRGWSTSQPRRTAM